MDELDRRILALLVDDGRRSLEDLGHRVGLSAPAVKRRVDRLRDAGVLQGFTAVVDDAAFGWHTEAFVQLYLTGTSTVADLLVALRGMPETLGAWTVDGKADVLVHLRATDTAALDARLRELRGKNLVSRTRTQMVLTRLLARSRATRAAAPGADATEAE
jgi:DNA-binding Lrp family transcriptional regulator